MRISQVRENAAFLKSFNICVLRRFLLAPGVRYWFNLRVLLFAGFLSLPCLSCPRYLPFFLLLYFVLCRRGWFVGLSCVGMAANSGFLDAAV